jgi:hypothetical protein
MKRFMISFVLALALSGPASLLHDLHMTPKDAVINLLDSHAPDANGWIHIEFARWQHVAVVHDSIGARLYVDGREVSQ